MQKKYAIATMLFWLMGGPAVQAQTVIDWIAPEQQRITVVDNADEHRQVRFTAGWETADYLVFNWHDLRGEIVYLRANDDRVAIDFPLTVAEIPQLFRIGTAGKITLGKSGHGAFLFGDAFGQRFTIAGNTLSCFSFASNDAPQSANARGLPQRMLYGYACAGAEQPRAEIEDFLRDIHFVDRGYVEKDAAPAAATTEVAGARQFALGQNATGTTPQGLNEVPLGYAVWDPIGGG